jgi:hypothetical protein
MTTDIEGCSGHGDAGEAHVSQVGRCRQHVAEDNDGSGSLAEMAETTRPGSDEDDAVDDADAERRCSDDSMQGLAPHRGMLECDQTGCAHGCTDEALCVSVSDSVGVLLAGCDDLETAHGSSVLDWLDDDPAEARPAEPTEWSLAWARPPASVL